MTTLNRPSRQLHSRSISWNRSGHQGLTPRSWREIPCRRGGRHCALSHRRTSSSVADGRSSTRLNEKLSTVWTHDTTAIAIMTRCCCLSLFLWIDFFLLHQSTAFLLCSDRNRRQYIFQSRNRPKMIHSNAKRFTEVEAIIFDVDGTLADSGNLGFTATLHLLDKYKIPPITYKEYCDHTRYTTPDRLARHASLIPGTEEFQRCGQALAKEFDDLYISQVSLETAGLFPGLLDLLRALPPSVKIAALTNAACQYAHAVLKVNDEETQWLYTRFSSIHGADDVPRPKPFPDGLWQICSELGVSADSCVYVGDSPSDGEAAKAAGMSSIGVGWGAHPIDSLLHKFDATVDSVEDLKKLLMGA